jgi:YidC/Oxa1 family membrane protein insertase
MVQGEPAPKPPPDAVAPEAEAPVQEAMPLEEAPELPLVPALPAAPSTATTVLADSERPGPPVRAGTVLRIERPLFTVEFNTLGAEIQRWVLREYDAGPKDDHRPIELVAGLAVLGTPFQELGLGNLGEASFELVADDGEQVVFQLVRGGVTVRKTYTFGSSGYDLRLRVDVENRSATPVEPRFAVTWPTEQQEGQDFRELALTALHDGSVEREILSGLGRPGFMGSFSGKPPKTIYDYPSEIDWAGIQTTYFLGAVLPDKPSEASARFVALDPGRVAVAQIFFAPVHVPPGRSAAREFRVYAGPKESDLLQELGAGLSESIDLGWSWIAPMTRFFNWLLGVLHAVVPNYGLAIIVLTILVRVVTAPLTTKQMRSMERMRELQPKLKAIQEKYSDDRQKQSEEQMRLYKSEGVNPLGGCLPMLLQLPVMIGLFYSLRSSIQLRQAPFVGWIDDLSAPETLFELPGVGLPVRVLPLVMGATMVLQQRMTPMNVDPTQARMMMTVMPIMMTVLFYQFASGLVLYWMVGNVLAIVHQLWIRRQRAAKE